jgi:hypothetical protein
MQDLHKWNQTATIERYEGFGFTTSKGSTCNLAYGLRHCFLEVKH